MRSALLVLALFGGWDACGNADHAPTPNHEFICLPCDGDGPDMAVSTPIPVPIVAYETWDLCFDIGDPEACWYGCPGPLNQTRQHHGSAICEGDGGCR